MYCTPETPSGRDTVLIDNGGTAALIIIEQLRVAAPEALSDTCTAKADVPGVVGAPEICPCCPSSTRPDGSCPLEMDQLYGGVPPDAVRDAVYA